MDAATILRSLSVAVATRAQLVEAGATGRDLTAAVRSGSMVRVRTGFYALPGVDPKIEQAVRIGGRLTCVSAAAALGIWVPDHPFAHVALRHEASRLRSPGDRLVPLTEHNLGGCVLHWWPLPSGPRGETPVVDPVDCLVHIIRCQPREIAVAALDSAMQTGLIRRRALDRIFAAVPAKFGYLRALVEPRCQSGIESVVRLILIDLGIPFEVQVGFRGIGTVDFVVAGCLVIETDGRAWHSDEPRVTRDYDRDVALIALGYAVLRLNYRQVMFERDRVIAAILGALRAHRRGPAL